MLCEAVARKSNDHFFLDRDSVLGHYERNHLVNTFTFHIAP